MTCKTSRIPAEWGMGPTLFSFSVFSVGPPQTIRREIPVVVSQGYGITLPGNATTNGNPHFVAEYLYGLYHSRETVHQEAGVIYDLPDWFLQRMANSSSPEKAIRELAWLLYKAYLRFCKNSFGWWEVCGPTGHPPWPLASASEACASPVSDTLPTTPLFCSSSP